MNTVVSKPSDGVMLFIIVCCGVLALWMMASAGKKSEESEGCAHLIFGYLTVVVLFVVGALLVGAFQAIYPGH